MSKTPEQLDPSAEAPIAGRLYALQTAPANLLLALQGMGVEANLTQLQTAAEQSAHQELQQVLNVQNSQQSAWSEALATQAMMNARQMPEDPNFN